MRLPLNIMWETNQLKKTPKQIFNNKKAKCCSIEAQTYMKLRSWGSVHCGFFPSALFGNKLKLFVTGFKQYCMLPFIKWTMAHRVVLSAQRYLLFLDKPVPSVCSSAIQHTLCHSNTSKTCQYSGCIYISLFLAEAIYKAEVSVGSLFLLQALAFILHHQSFNNCRSENTWMFLKSLKEW